MKIINNLPKKIPLQDQIGKLSNLTTTIKTNLVVAINWLHALLLEKLGSADISSIGDGTVTGAINELNTNLSKKLFYPDFANRLRQYNGTSFEYTVDSSGAFLIAKITNTDNVNYQACVTIDDVAVGETSKGETSWLSFPVAPGSTIKSKTLSNVNYDIWVYALK